MADLPALLASADLINLIADDQSLVAAADLAHLVVVVARLACLEVTLQVVVQVLKKALEHFWLAD